MLIRFFAGKFTGGEEGIGKGEGITSFH